MWIDNEDGTREWKDTNSKIGSVFDNRYYTLGNMCCCIGTFLFIIFCLMGYYSGALKNANTTIEEIVKSNKKYEWLHDAYDKCTDPNTPDVWLRECIASEVLLSK
jgi:hypothetical protein